VSESTKNNPKAPKRSSRRKPAMEPLGWDEIVSQPGMGGYLSFLNGPIPLPHLQPPAPEPDPDPVVASDPAVVPHAAVATAPALEPTSVIAPSPAPVIALAPVLDPTPTVAPSPSRPLTPSLQSTPVVASAPVLNPIPAVAPSPLRPLAPSLAPTPVVAPTTRRPRIRKCAAAHDGHSLGEEVLYQALWKAAAAESAGARIIVIGWRGMSQLCRMTPKNCKINTQRLMRKLALEVLSPYNTPESIGTTYRIFPSEAILCRRRAAGLEWVVRSRGVEFVDPATGMPLSAHLCGYVSGLPSQLS
jgi:hypothetical protein